MEIAVKACRSRIDDSSLARKVSSDCNHCTVGIIARLHPSCFTFQPFATEDVDPAVIARCPSMAHSFGRKTSTKKEVWATPGWQLGAYTKIRSGDTRNTNSAPYHSCSHQEFWICKELKSVHTHYRYYKKGAKANRDQER